MSFLDNNEFHKLSRKQFNSYFMYSLYELKCTPPPTGT